MTKKPFTSVHQKRFYTDLLDILANYGCLEDDKEILEYMYDQFGEFCKELDRDPSRKTDAIIDGCFNSEHDAEYTLKDTNFAFIVPEIRQLFLKYGLVDDNPKEGATALFTTSYTTHFTCPYCSQSTNYRGSTKEWECDSCKGKFNLKEK